MLPAPRRLRSDRDYRRLYRTSRPIHGRFVSIRAAATTAPVSRFGVVISKKVSKSSVTRNLVKRRIREIVAKLPATPRALDVALIAGPKSPDATFGELSQEITAIWHHIIHAPPRHR